MSYNIKNNLFKAQVREMSILLRPTDDRLYTYKSD